MYDFSSVDEVRKNIALPLKEGFEKENIEGKFSIDFHKFMYGWGD